MPVFQEEGPASRQGAHVPVRFPGGAHVPVRWQWPLHAQDPVGHVPPGIIVDSSHSPFSMVNMLIKPCVNFWLSS